MIFPYEYYLPLENNPHLLLRVTINKYQNFYSSEMDIIFSESYRIFHHIGIRYRELDPEEALYNAIQEASNFLSKK